MAVRPIDANALHKVISAWPESIMYKDWVQSAIATASTLTPPNEPLTLEQLLEMVGKPVYIIANDMGIAEWNVIKGKDLITVGYDVPFNGMKAVKEALGFINGRSFRLDTYGTSWLVYRRPPEGEADA